MKDEIKVVIGSWGSYNKCNERALGSKWLDLSDYGDWEEIEEELKKQGFELDGIDKELFVQDIEGLDCDGYRWDRLHPKELFETLYESDVLNDQPKYETLTAFLEVRDFDYFRGLVDRHGYNWDADIQLWAGYDWEDLGREMLADCEIPDWLEDYIDYERYGESFGYDYDIYSGGLIYIP